MIRDRSLPSQLKADKEIKVLCAHEFAHAKMSLGDIPRSREIYLSLSFASFALVDKNQNHFFCGALPGIRLALTLFSAFLDE